MRHKWDGLLLSIVLFGAGWIFAALIQSYPAMASVWRLIFIGWFVLLGFAGFCVGLFWGLQRIAMTIQQFSTAKEAGRVLVLTARKEIALILLKMDPKQLELFGNTRVFIDIIPGDPPIGPLYEVRLPGGYVSWEFVEEFLNLSSKVELPEVRQWSGGSYKRTSAELLTTYFVSEGFAHPAAGNRPATWINKENGLIAIGYLKENTLLEELEDGNDS